MCSIPSSIATICRCSATPLPDFCSIVYQPLRSRPLNREIHPSAPAGGSGDEDTIASARLRGSNNNGLPTIGTPTLMKSLRLMMCSFLYRDRFVERHNPQDRENYSFELTIDPVNIPAAAKIHRLVRRAAHFTGRRCAVD